MESFHIHKTHTKDVAFAISYHAAQLLHQRDENGVYVNDLEDVLFSIRDEYQESMTKAAMAFCSDTMSDAELDAFVCGIARRYVLST